MGLGKISAVVSNVTLVFHPPIQALIPTQQPTLPRIAAFQWTPLLRNRLVLMQHPPRGSPFPIDHGSLHLLQMHQLRRCVLITIEKKTPAQRTDLHRPHLRLSGPRDYSIVSEGTVSLLRTYLLPEMRISRWETLHAPFQKAEATKHRLSKIIRRIQDRVFSTSGHHHRHFPQSPPVGQSPQVAFRRVLHLQRPHAHGAKSSQTKKTRFR